MAEELNSFFTRFEVNGQTAPPPAFTYTLLSLQEHQVRKVLREVNPRKAARPDGVSGKVLKACAVQLSGVLTKIFNISLSLAIVPSCWKSATIIPVPKTSACKSLNDFRPIALTYVAMKCLERLVAQYITAFLPPSFDSHYTGSPQGCVKKNCRRHHCGRNESEYRAEVQKLSTWCSSNKLLLNTTKTKEIIIDFRHNCTALAPLHLNGDCVERVSSFKFLGSVIESILTFCITAWYAGCSAADRKALQRVIGSAQKIIGCPLPSLEELAESRCLNSNRSIFKDSAHPAHHLFNLLPSGRRFRTLRC
ncbi:hypothetical protein N1851_029819 [Merluccius polli]|uniref:Reverse transcriptase n=1 Tax=Merluccius polli TaxID=89951 RepID=A0AA47M6M3_MERPO|nr:hypothetical protein N1851_029819 [Merluccius polli]